MLVNIVGQIEPLKVSSYSDLVSFYPPLNGIRYNHVISVSSNGKNSSELTSELDRLALKAIRSQSDLIVTTGQTARVEQLKASSFADLLIITNDADLKIPALAKDSTQKVLLSVDHVHAANINAIAVGKTTEPITDWFQRTFMADYKSIVLESGLSTAVLFAKANLINELCLTVTGTNSNQDADEAVRQFTKKLGLRGTHEQMLSSETTWLYRISILK